MSCFASVSLHCVRSNVVQLRILLSFHSEVSLCGVVLSQVWKIFNFASVKQSCPGLIRSRSNGQTPFQEARRGWTSSRKRRKSLRRGQYASCNNVSVNVPSTGGKILLCDLKPFWKQGKQIVTVLSGRRLRCLLLKLLQCGYSPVGVWCNWTESSRNPPLQKALVTCIVCSLYVRTIRFGSFFFSSSFLNLRRRFQQPVMLWCLWLWEISITWKIIHINNLWGLKDVTRRNKVVFFFFYRHIIFKI